MKRLVLGFVLGALLGAASGWFATRPRLDRDGKPITIGRLRLRTYPKGAQVWIDGKLEVVSTPATLIREAGRYHLFIQAPGAEGIEREIEIEAGRSRSLDLRIPAPPAATVTVLSDVEGAEVRINGYKRGETPLLRATTKPGPIDVTITDPGGRARSVRGELELGEQEWIEVFFGDVVSENDEEEEEHPRQCHPKRVGYVSIGLQPNGIVETSGGEVLGETPLLDHAMEPGVYSLILRSKDGKQEKRVSIEVRPDERSVYRFMLQSDDLIR